MAHRRRHKRRFHRNPPGGGFGGITSQLWGNTKRAAIGAGGIVANGFATDALGTALNLDAKTKSLVGLLIPLLGFPLIARFTKLGILAEAAPAASSVALLKAVQQFVPTFSTGLTGVGDQYLLRRDMEAPRALLGATTMPYPIAG